MNYSKNQRNRKSEKCSSIATYLSVAMTLVAFIALMIPEILMAQVNYVPLPFKNRTSIYSPEKSVYHIQGDFQIIGNTNLTLKSAPATGPGATEMNNSKAMKYIDVDGDPNTVNSSSAQLKFSTEHGANPECTEVVFAGLYWQGRKSKDFATDSTSITVSGHTLYNQRVKFKHEDGSYQEVIANPADCYQPTPTDGLRNIYSCYAEVTDYVRQYGEGNYYVADICTRANVTADGAGFFGGWSLVVIYENSKMKWRDVSVFDGYAMLKAENPEQVISIDGIRTVQVGHVNLKLGMFAGEGDGGAGHIHDYVEIKNTADNYVYLSQDGSTSETCTGIYDNFFRSYISVGDVTRNPNFLNNTGVDIAMFTLQNPDNSIITNEQTSVSFKFGSSLDMYVPSCLVFGCDAYIPDARVVDAVVESPSAIYDPVEDVWVTHPGDTVTFTMKVHNYDDEDIRDGEIRLPLPVTIDYYSVEAEYSDGRTGTYYFDPNQGINGTAVWTIDYLPAGYPDSVWATFKLNCKVTKDCFVLASSDEDCLLRLIVNGTLSGTSVINGISFTNEFIQGFQQSGTCTGGVISEDLVVVVDRDAYVKAHCNCSTDPGVYSNTCYIQRDLPYCVPTLGTDPVPFEFVSQYYPLGTRFYNLAKTQEYTVYTGFPQAVIGETLIAAAPAVGAGSCDSRVVILDGSATGTTPADPTFSETSLTYCKGSVAASLKTLVTSPNDMEPLYVVFYTENPTTHPEAVGAYDYVPSTAEAGTTTIWARQFSKDNPCYESALTTLTITVNESLNITSSHETPSCQGVAVTFTPSVAGGTYDIPAAIAAYVTVTGGVATLDAAAPAGTYEFSYTAPASAVVVTPCDPSSLTQTVKHVITPASVGGDITPTPITICLGSDIPQLTLQNFEGHVQKWEYRKEPDAIWTLIPNNTWRITQTDISELTEGIYHFRALVKSGECTEEYSAEAIVTVKNVTAPAAPTVTTPHFACPGETFTFPTSAGLVWYENEVGGTGSTTAPTVTMGTSWIQRYVSYVDAESCESHRVMVEVRPTLSAGSIVSGNEARCDGSAPSVIGSATDAALTLDNTLGTIEYQWFAAKDGAAAVAITGATAATFDPAAYVAGLGNGTYVFTRKAKTSTCTEWIESNGTWTLTMGSPNAEITTTSPVICGTTGSVTLSVVSPGSPLAYAYQWKKDGANIADANNTSYVATETGNYAVVVTHRASTCATTSTPITIQRDVTAPTATDQSSTVEGCGLADLPAAYTTVAELEAGLGMSISDDFSADADITVTSADVTISTTCPYQVERTYTLTDACGNTATFVHTITIKDTQKPTFTRPADITIYRNLTCGYNVAVAVTGDVTDEADNCSTGLDATYVDADATPATACEGTKIIKRTWSLVDDCGNAADDQVQTITVLDNIAPTLSGTWPADVTGQNNCKTGADVSVLASDADVKALYTDCSTITITHVDAPATGDDCAWEIVRTFTIKDACDNSTTNTQKLSGGDNTAPTLTGTWPADVTGQNNCKTGADVSVLASDADVKALYTDCSTITVTHVDAPATGDDCAWEIVRTFTIKDACDNSTTNTQKLSGGDNTAPDFDVPADITICRNNTTGAIEAPTTLTGVPSNHSDNCATVTLLETNTSFVDLDTLPAANNANRIIRREWKVTDACGNETKKIQNITVRPSILTPGNYDFTCPSDITVVLPYNACEMFVNIGYPEYMNHMVGMNVTIANDAPAGSIFPEGTTIVKWTATDECGASIFCNQKIVVQFPPCGTPADSTTDANGNRYSSVRIGCQCWTGENLRPTDYFNNDCSATGEAITVAKYYEMKDSLENLYGKLYSWYSAVGVPENDNAATPATKTTPEGVKYVQGLCPCGWAVPTPEQYATMVSVSGGADYVKTTDSRFWLPGKEGVDPTALFKARGAGYYNADNDRYEELMGVTGFWTVDNTSTSAVGTSMLITHYCQDAIPDQKLKSYAFSVRCIRME